MLFSVAETASLFRRNQQPTSHHMTTLEKHSNSSKKPKSAPKTHSASPVGKLALKYLHEWTTGGQPSSDAYLAALPDEKSRNKFKEAVAMGKLLRQALS